MKRRSALSLDPSANNDTKRVPGFETTESTSGDGATREPEPIAITAWSSAQPKKPRKPRSQAGERVAAPKWRSVTVVRGLLLVVTGAVALYLLRKRLV